MIYNDVMEDIDRDISEDLGEVIINLRSPDGTVSVVSRDELKKKVEDVRERVLTELYREKIEEKAKQLAKVAEGTLDNISWGEVSIGLKGTKMKFRSYFMKLDDGGLLQMELSRTCDPWYNAEGVKVAASEKIYDTEMRFVRYNENREQVDDEAFWLIGCGQDGEIYNVSPATNVETVYLGDGFTVPSERFYDVVKSEIGTEDSSSSDSMVMKDVSRTEEYINILQYGTSSAPPELFPKIPGLSFIGNQRGLRKVDEWWVDRAPGKI